MREERFSSPDPIRLECSIAAGTVTVATTDAAEATVSLDGPAPLIDAMRVELVGDRLMISEQRMSRLGLRARPEHSIHVAARVPHGSSVSAKTASADVELDGIVNDVEMQSASGDLRASGDITGDVSVKSASGDARLPRVSGRLEVRGVSGDVDAESVGRSLAVAIVSGDVRIDALREGDVSVRSVSGDIVLGIEPGSAIDLDATSASGRLVSEVPLSDSPDDGDGPTVVIHAITASGDVRVTRAAAAPA